MSEKNRGFITTKVGLLFHFGKDNEEILVENFINLLIKKNISFHCLNDNDFDLTISQLIENINHQEQIDFTQLKESKIDENVLFFSGFTREEMENFLEILRDPRYPRFELKAVATKTNQNFLLNELIQELRQDRMVISYVIALRKGINLLKEKSEIVNNINLKEEIENEIVAIEEILININNIFDINVFKDKISKVKLLIKEIDENSHY
ncbi:MAG: DUF3783 domain-containing protein [Clostridiaceae bacterium]|nr:DUF3783 domain-containing protein [Clostridiaceae bacterium]